MLSPNSPAPPDTEAGPMLLSALAEVAENSLFAFCDSGSRETYLEAVEVMSEATPPDETGTWLHAVVVYHGDSTGAIELGVPAGLARDLCAAFAGEDDPARITDAALHDFHGEVANMVCGLWLTRRSRLQRFDLSAPRVVALSTRACVARALEDTAGREMLFAAINDAPVWVCAGPAPRS